MSAYSSHITRVGIVGLSKDSWASVSHLVPIISSDKYQVVALLNSSANKAKSAIKEFGLPASTAAYGDPQEFANDPNIDLVVNSVRVDNHFDTLRPSLIAGKSVVIEWPLGKNLAEAEELLRLSKAHGVKQAFVAMQDTASPILQQLRSFIKEGRIGKILSSSFTAQTDYINPLQPIPEKFKYFLDPTSGGNIVAIFVAHAIAQVEAAFDETLEISSSLLTNQIPNVTIVKDDGAPYSDHKRTHDHTMFLARAAKSQFPLSFSVRSGPAFKGTPGLDWRVYGEKGEIRITASKATLADGLYGDETFHIHDFADGKDEVVEVKFEDEYAHLGIHARNTTRMYDAIRNGESAKLWDFDQAVQIHRFVDQLVTANPI